MFRAIIGGPYADIGRAVYDRLLVDVKPGLPDFDDWFPEPPGMDTYRAARQKLDAESDVERVKQVENKQQ
jgi:hypothetical protein